MRKALFLSLTTGILLAGIFMLSRQFLAQPVSVIPSIQTSDWALEWWEARHQSKIAQAHEQSVELVFIGDSITQHWESAGKQVWDEHYQKLNSLNLGFAGDRTEHVLWRLQNGAVDNIQPKVAVLLIGTNNTGQRMDSTQDTLLGIKAIVSEIRQRLPKTKLLLLAIFPSQASPKHEMRLRNSDINTHIADLNKLENVFFLDIGKIFVGPRGKLNTELMPDLLHLSAEGYQRWAESMAPLLSQLLQ